MVDNASVSDESRKDDLSIIGESSSSRNYCRRKSDVWEFFLKKTSRFYVRFATRNMRFTGVPAICGTI